MAAITVTCPWCEQEVQIDEEDFVGAAAFRCPNCQMVVEWAPDPEKSAK